MSVEDAGDLEGGTTLELLLTFMSESIKHLNGSKDETPLQT